MAPQYEGEKVVKFLVGYGLIVGQMVQYECTKHWKPTVSFSFGVVRTPFSNYWPSGVIRIIELHESSCSFRVERTLQEINIKARELPRRCLYYGYRVTQSVCPRF